MNTSVVETHQEAPKHHRSARVDDRVARGDQQGIPNKKVRKKGVKMVMSSTRACTACHAAKVKCVKVEGSTKCKRCERLGLKCIEHISRQGQGTRRRKKAKTKVQKNDVQQCIFSAPICTPLNCNITNDKGSMSKKSTTENGASTCYAIPMGYTSTVICDGSGGNNMRNNDGSLKQKQPDPSTICAAMDALEVEDKIICSSITSGLGKDHFGLNHIIRQWIALAFSRRSFSLLARASFIAEKMKIPMDDIISNQSPFAAATDSEPMDFLAADILLSKKERKTLGYPIDLREIPWDLLESVQIDPKRLEETTRNRCIAIRWASQGSTRYWTSPVFCREFASTAEIGQVWEENKEGYDTIDLFIEKSEKGRFAQNLFHIIFVNSKPNMPCYVTKDRHKVQRRNNAPPIEANVIQTIKLLDLDASIHYCEIQFLDDDISNANNLVGDGLVRANKRDYIDDHSLDNIDPFLGDGIEFTDIPVTDEMIEFMKLISGE